MGRLRDLLRLAAQGSTGEQRLRSRLLVLGAVFAVAASVWVASQIQRQAAVRGFAADRSSSGLVRSMADQETGLRGFVLTGDDEFLKPYAKGRRDFDFNLAALREQARDRSSQLEKIDALESMGRRWQTSAERAIDRVRRRGPRSVPAGDTERMRALMGSLRDVSGRFADAEQEERDRSLRIAGFISMAVAAAVSLLLGSVGYLLLARGIRAETARRREEDDYRESQDEFARALQVTRAEAEAHDLLRRHLERSMGASVAVLTRDNEEGELQAKASLDAGSPLAARLESATPESCMAIRLGQPYDRTAGREPLLRCDLCGDLGGGVSCVPSLVGGEVIGSVMAHEQTDLGEHDRRRLAESVAQAAPVLGNLRNLAVAETRAATDALTGLSNQRSAAETLRRLVAQSSRTVSPLAAIVFDLDRFKDVNDRFGHAKGDEVLAAVGETAATTVRASDFVARQGGEEFLVLLPDTDREGARIVAEKLRETIAALDVGGLDRRITASFGVATFPADGSDADALLGAADRALYAAKAAGRDRVEVSPPLSPAPVD